MALLVCLLVFLAITGHSSATYCVCKDGPDTILQKTLDYACGNGADCSAILEKGGCYNPNTVKDHCSYAVNSYFQRKGQAPGTCDFSSTATVTANPPPNIASTCSFPSSNTGTTTGTTPTTGSTTTGIPTTGSTTGIPTTGSTTTGTPTVFGGGGATTLGPSGTTTGFGDPNNAVGLFTTTNNNNLFFTFVIMTTLWIVGLSWV